MNRWIRAERSRLTVAAPTRTEALAAGWALRGRARVVRVGVACRRGTPETSEPLVVCGLAGALGPGLAPGTVLVPEELAMGSEWTVCCDPGLVRRLSEAARRLGLEPENGPLLTVSSLVTGRQRREWARRGPLSVDMESATLVRAARGPAAVVRVVLDTPERELLRSLPWAPAYAVRAGAVIRELLQGAAPAL